MTRTVGANAISRHIKKPLFDGTSSLPSHIEHTVRAIAGMHAEHRENAGRLQRLVDNVTRAIGRPRSVALATSLLALWIGGNLFVLSTGRSPIDRPPFNMLQTGLAVASFYLTLSILATQRKEDELGSYREQLTLQLAILSEQKSAKIISLLEEIRRDSPTLRNRIDEEADAMSVITDHRAVFEAIRSSDDEAEQIADGNTPAVRSHAS